MPAISYSCKLEFNFFCCLQMIFIFGIKNTHNKIQHVIHFVIFGNIFNCNRIKWKIRWITHFGIKAYHIWSYTTITSLFIPYGCHIRQPELTQLHKKEERKNKKRVRHEGTKAVKQSMYL